MKKIILFLLVSFSCIMGQSQTKIDYHNGTYYLDCYIAKDDEYDFIHDYYPLGGTTIKITIEPDLMVFEPDEKFKEADLELTGTDLHSLTFFLKSDTTFHATGNGEAFIQYDLLGYINTGILISDDHQPDGVYSDYLIFTRSSVFFEGIERAVVYMGNAIFIPEGTNRRISLESNAVKKNILKFLKNEKAVGYIKEKPSGSGKPSNSGSVNTKKPFSNYADSYMKGTYFIENPVLKYDGNDKYQKSINESITISGNEHSFMVHCPNLSLYLGFDTSRKNCYLVDYKNGLRECIWTNAKQYLGNKNENTDFHVSLSMMDDIILLTIIKTRNRKVLVSYKIPLTHEARVTFKRKGSERKVTSNYAEVANAIFNQFTYHIYKSGNVFTDYPFF